MEKGPRPSPGKDITAKWDGMDLMERLNLVMTYENLFWALRLITLSEIARLRQMHESNREYVLKREDQPFFASIDLKKNVAAQVHRNKLKAALKAVFG